MDNLIKKTKDSTFSTASAFSDKLVRFPKGKRIVFRNRKCNKFSKKKTIVYQIIKTNLYTNQLF